LQQIQAIAWRLTGTCGQGPGHILIHPMTQWNYQRFPKENFRNAPDAPGIYKYLDKQGNIIYVGKAKSLKKRVASYFLAGAKHSIKTTRLVQEVKDIEVVIVNSEPEALLLENNLIKEIQPKYNILLKDGKSYPFICIPDEPFPRVYSTRKTDEIKGEYFGPFTNGYAMYNLLELIRKVYMLRTCALNLSNTNIKSGKFKVCLEYHLKNCKGPCEGHQTLKDYDEDIRQIRHILKGNLSPVRKQLKENMEVAARSLEFESAQLYKNKLESLEDYQAKSLIANPKMGATDVFSIESDGSKSYVNYMRIDKGLIKQSETIEVERKLDEQESEILALVMFNFRKKYDSDAKEILSNIQVETWEGQEASVPKIGDKKKLVDLSLKNVRFFRVEKANQVQQLTPTEKILRQLQEDLTLPDLPVHIECFDNSNIQGSDPVASMVCFKHGRPSKKDYRKFIIKTVTGPDDFSSMKEIVVRRYRRMTEEQQPLPNLILIDGGKGQLGAACEALQELGIYEKVPIVGIAKRLEEIYYPNDPYPIHISKKSPSLKLIQRIRDEAHRFAITFHRDKRSKGQLTSELDVIGGIGPKTKEKLLSTYKSVNRIKAASIPELAQWIGLSKAQTVFKALNKKEDHS
jgi:excinuclease ABC subunit C